MYVILGLLKGLLNLSALNVYSTMGCTGQVVRSSLYGALLRSSYQMYSADTRAPLEVQCRLRTEPLPWPP